MRNVSLTAAFCLIAGCAVPEERLPGAESAPAPSAAGLIRAGYEDYRTPVGRVEQGVLRIALDAHPAEWRPWGDDGPAVLANVFAADGKPARAPAPLIRAAVGQPMEVTVRNHFADTLVVSGLRWRRPATPGQFVTGSADTVVVAPGATVTIPVTRDTPGTFIYTGNVNRRLGERLPLPGDREGNRTFMGLFVVDPPDAARVEERFFLITHWADAELPASFLPATRFLINGRSWPLTERLSYTQGDTVRWRVVNMTGRPHPMHLHGFYYSVDGEGSFFGDAVIPPDQRELVVTHRLQPGSSMRMSFVPEEPGNWIFHCHFMRHMSWMQTAPLEGEPVAHHDSHAAEDGERMMGGLVVGIHVSPAPGYVARAEVPRRRLALHINRRPGVFGEAAGYGFVLQEDERQPAADSVRFPGSPIVLTRGEPTEIVVRNRADVPLGVHWHGLELESWADGVPGWSGMSGRVTPAIPPGDSLAVRMTPPRAGSFMYHVHSEPGHQLAQGLYGPFLVLEPGERWDPEHDLVFMLGSLGTGEDPPAAVNGLLRPEPLELRAGSTYRLRFMHMSPDDDKRISLLRGDEPVRWRFVAKDGADLPAQRIRELAAADLSISVGRRTTTCGDPRRPASTR